MAVDGQINTFWASKFDDTAEPVEFLVDLGATFNVQHMEILWEFPARAFFVLLSSDGENFLEVFATSANVMPTSSLPLGAQSARKVRIMMTEVWLRASHESFDQRGSHSFWSCGRCALLFAASPNGCIVRKFYHK